MHAGSFSGALWRDISQSASIYDALQGGLGEAWGALAPRPRVSRLREKQLADIPDLDL
jgi:hypothetical protein